MDSTVVYRYNGNMIPKRYVKIAVVLESYPKFRDAEDYLCLICKELKDKFGIDPRHIDTYRPPTLSLLPDKTWRCEFAVEEAAVADLHLAKNGGNKKILSIVSDGFTPPGLLKAPRP